MELRELSPDDAAGIRDVVEIENARVAADSPWEYPATPYRKEMQMRHGWDGEVARHFLAYADGARPVGYATVGTSEWDNRDLAWLDVTVAPEHRRQGHGSRLLEAAVAQARGMGRHLVCVGGWESPGAAALAARTGFAKKAQEINRQMRLGEVDAAVVRAARDEGADAAADYELLRIVGSSPEELVAAVAQMTEAINDAPTDDLDREDESFPVERIRAYEHAVDASGYRMYRLVARHRESGELGGHTVVVVDSETPAQGDQHDTSVVRSHRGHRLGLLLKAEMVLWLAQAEPQVEVVDTWNAESNAHMIRVNDRLGYRVMGRHLTFERRYA